MKKKLLCTYLFLIIIITINAQSDSLKIAHSLKDRFYPIIVCQGKSIAEIKKQERPFFNSIYNPSGLQNNYLQYRYKEPYSTSKTVIGAAGNILLSILADKTNHMYRSAPF